MGRKHAWCFAQFFFEPLESIWPLPAAFPDIAEVSHLRSGSETWWWWWGKHLPQVHSKDNCYSSSSGVHPGHAVGTVMGLSSPIPNWDCLWSPCASCRRWMPTFWHARTKHSLGYSGLFCSLPSKIKLPFSAGPCSSAKASNIHSWFSYFIHFYTARPVSFPTSVGAEAYFLGARVIEKFQSLQSQVEIHFWASFNLNYPWILSLLAHMMSEKKLFSPPPLASQESGFPKQHCIWEQRIPCTLYFFHCST